MIASIEGYVITSYHDYIVIAVNGLGYKVYVPDRLLNLTGEHILLHTHLVVREDSLTLYGFNQPADRELFEKLLTISGVGPRLALAILSTMSVDNLRTAVMSERAELLTRVPGIGKKTAQRILIELKDKLAVGLDALPSSAFDDVNTDVIDALVALGYSIVEAQLAIQSLPADTPNDVEERVRRALEYFI